MDAMKLSEISKTVAMVDATKRKGVLSLLEPTAWERMMETQRRNERLLNYTAMSMQQTVSLLQANLLQPTALDNFMRSQEKIDRILGYGTALDRIVKQQEKFDRIIKGPSVLGLGTSLAAMPSGLVEQAADYGSELAEDLLDEDVPSERVEEALSRLADQREAILKCVERINESAIAAGLFGVPIPNVVLALMIVFYIVGDAANEIIIEREGDER
jgi:hypothetical protein